ncbi:MAG: DotD/TraH family lipoprotein [Pseudomonadota bacterium]
MTRPSTLPLIVLTAALALGGCQANPVRINNPQLVAEPDKVSALLAQAADRSSRAMENLAAIEQTRTPRVNMATPSDLPAELQRGATVNWVGPVENVTKMMADRASYGFSVSGDAPPAPIVVTVDMENAPIFDILKSIGLQMGNRGDVSVDASTKTIELNYAPVTGLGQR